MEITTCTFQSESLMNEAISKGFKFALHLESTDKPCGKAFFAKTKLALREYYRAHAREFEQWMIAEYGESVSEQTTIKTGWT